MKINLLISLLLSQICFSQVTITKAFNDPVVGDVVNNKNVVGTVNNAGSGSGQTFDNSLLTAGTPIVTTFSTPTSAEITSYPGTTIKSSDGATTSFFKQSSSKLEITALITTEGTLSFAGDNATAIQYPFAFGNSVVDNAKGTFTSTTASGLIKGTVTITADASGTLIMSGNTYSNVLRVKTVQNFNLYQSSDTFYTFPIGTITGTSYQYYNASSKQPLLSSISGNISVPILSFNQSTNQAVAQSTAFLGTKDVQFVEDFVIYPNPAQNFIKLKGNIDNQLEVEIFSFEGKYLKKSLVKNELIDISNLTPGTYILKLIGKDVQRTIKFIKK